MSEPKRDMRNECWHCAHSREVPGNAHIKCVKPDAGMVGNLLGIREGWFFYPLLFDPTWKEVMCKNYQNHESVETVVSGSVSVAGESK